MDRLPVRAVQRAFDLVAALAGEQAPATLSALARHAGLATSTAARLLGTLVAAGFVQRDADGRYRPGMQLIRMGLNALRGQTLFELAEPHLQALAERTGETANLAVRSDSQHWVYLRQVLSRRAIHHGAWTGRLLPLSGTATGAALLGGTGTLGYVVQRGAVEPDVTAVAAPVLGPTGHIAGALSITGPSYRIGDGDLAKFGAALSDQATRLSAQLGAVIDSRSS